MSGQRMAWGWRMRSGCCVMSCCRRGLPVRGSDVQLPVESMTVVLKVTATRSVDGKAGFQVPIVELELGGGVGRERGSEQTVAVVFDGPVDSDGRPVKVAQESKQRKG
jgi:Trypsin-co-occurring domain 2